MIHLNDTATTRADNISMERPDFEPTYQQVCELMNQEKYREAISLLHDWIQESEGPPKAYLALGECHFYSDEHNKAFQILKRGVELFPMEYELHRTLGRFSIEDENIIDAEEHIRRARSCVREDAARLAEWHVVHGDLLHAKHQQEAALAEWQMALQIDPKCSMAYERLDKAENARTDIGDNDSPMDDIRLFQKIHADRYLKAHGKTEFDSKEELTAFMNAIMNTWNTHIMPVSREMDQMSEKQKREIMSNVPLEFTPRRQPVISKTPVRKKHPRSEKRRKVARTADEKALLAFMGQLCPYLDKPEQGLVLFIVGLPTLRAIGISDERITQFFHGSKPTEHETYLMQFAWDYFATVRDACF